MRKADNEDDIARVEVKRDVVRRERGCRCGGIFENRYLSFSPSHIPNRACQRGSGVK